MKFRLSPLIGEETANAATVALVPQDLLIFPTRYAVMPEAASCILPGSIARHKEPELSGYRYGLRVLRSGYIYIYYQAHPLDSEHKWDVYQSDSQGELKLLDINSLKNAEPTVVIEAGNAIHIRHPEAQGKVWLAFSDHRWSDETLIAMEDDSALRDRRMQTIDVANWVANHYCSHGVIADEKNLAHILEYSENNTDFELISGDPKQPIYVRKPDRVSLYSGKQGVDGRYDSHQLARYYTSHASRMVHGGAAKLSRELAPDPSKPAYKALLFAFWDRIGALQEVSGFRHDPAGQFSRYQEELAMEVDAMHKINTISQHINESAAKAFEDDLQMAEMLVRVGGGRKIEMTQREFEQAMGELGQQDPVRYNPYNLPPGTKAYRLSEGQARVRIVLPSTDPRQIETERLVEKIRRHHRDKKDPFTKDLIAKDWKLFNKRLDMPRYQEFKNNNAAIESEVETLQQSRTQAVITLLTSLDFVDTLVEYHPNNLSDGVAYSQVIGDGIEALAASDKGETLLKTWINEANTQETNLLWCAMALNQTSAKQSLQKTLDQYQSTAHLPQFGGSRFWDDGKIAGMLKDFADIHTKALGLMTENNQLRYSNTTTNTGLAKIFSTVAHRFYKPLLKGAVNPVSNYIMDAIFSAQHHIDLHKMREDTQKRILQQESQLKASLQAQQAQRARHKSGIDATYWYDKTPEWQQSRIARYTQKIQKVDRMIDDILRQIDQLGKERLDAMQTLQTEHQSKLKTHHQHWTKTVADSDNHVANNLTAARFGMVVTLMQGWQLLQAIQALDKDDEDYAMLMGKALMVGMAFVGVSTELYLAFYTMATRHQTNAHVNQRALKLKATGASFGIIAGSAQAIFDFIGWNKATTENEVALSRVYLVKSIVGGLIALGSTAHTLGLFASQLEQVASRGMAHRAIYGVANWAKLATWMPGALLGGMIVLMAFDLFSYLFIDTKLQNWCERCAFRLENSKRDSTDKKHYYRSVQEQQQAFDTAMITS